MTKHQISTLRHLGPRDRNVEVVPHESLMKEGKRQLLLGSVALNLHSHIWLVVKLP